MFKRVDDNVVEDDDDGHLDEKRQTAAHGIVALVLVEVHYLFLLEEKSSNVMEIRLWEVVKQKV